MEVVSLIIKLSISVIYNVCDFANNSRKGIWNTISIETNTFDISTSPNPTAWRPLCVPLLWSEILTCPISNIFLFVKTSADYIRTKLTDSTHVNFSQSEHFVCTRFNFYVQWDSFLFYVFWSYIIWESTAKFHGTATRSDLFDWNYANLNCLFQRRLVWRLLPTSAIFWVLNFYL